MPRRHAMIIDCSDDNAVTFIHTLHTQIRRHAVTRLLRYACFHVYAAISRCYACRSRCFSCFTHGYAASWPERLRRLCHVFRLPPAAGWRRCHALYKRCLRYYTAIRYDSALSML